MYFCISNFVGKISFVNNTAKDGGAVYIFGGSSHCIRLILASSITPLIVKVVQYHWRDAFLTSMEMFCLSTTLPIGEEQCSSTLLIIVHVKMV